MSGGTRPSRGFWPLRDLPVVLWLTALVVIALVPPFVPAPRWLMIHLLLLDAVSHAILVWSKHFVDALLHTAPRAGDRRIQSVRLLLLNAGVAVVVGGVLGDAWPVTAAGAAVVAMAVLWHAAALVAQLKRALPARLRRRSTTTSRPPASCRPAQGGFVELTLAKAGHYPFVSHVMVDAERGAHGVLEVSP